MRLLLELSDLQLHDKSNINSDKKRKKNGKTIIHHIIIINIVLFTISSRYPILLFVPHGRHYALTRDIFWPNFP